MEFRSVWGGGEDDRRDQRSVTVLQVRTVCVLCTVGTVYIARLADSNLEHAYMRAHMFTRPHHRFVYYHFFHF